MNFILIYLLIINAVGFLVMTVDKLYAKKNMRRIPERTLLGVAVIGGSIGVWAGMYAARHKTKHMKFVIGIPLILLCQLGAVLYSILK